MGLSAARCGYWAAAGLRQAARGGPERVPSGTVRSILVRALGSSAARFAHNP